MTTLTVAGAGSWGTTVAALAATNADVTLWARDPELAERIDTEHANATYLPGIQLPEMLHATNGLAAAAASADCGLSL